MPTSDAQKKASKKYISEKCFEMKIRVPIDLESDIKERAKSQNLSVNSYIMKLIASDLTSESQKE